MHAVAGSQTTWTLNLQKHFQVQSRSCVLLVAGDRAHPEDIGVRAPYKGDRRGETALQELGRLLPLLTLYMYYTTLFCLGERAQEVLEKLILG